MKTERNIMYGAGVLVTLVVIFLMASVVISACVPVIPAKFVKTGMVRDTVFAVEERGNGAHIVWLTHSDVDGYCIPDKDTDISTIMRHEGEILITYHTISSAGSEFGQCIATESSGSEISTEITISAVAAYELVGSR